MHRPEIDQDHTGGRRRSLHRRDLHSTFVQQMNLFSGILIGIFSLLLLATGWLLFVLITIRVDTRNRIYEFRMGRIVRVNYETDGLSGKVFLTVFGVKRELKNPQTKTIRKTEDAAVKKRNRKKRSIAEVLHKVRAVLLSFRIVRFELDFDSGDVITNAYLVPVFFFLSGKRTRFRIRYDGENEIRFEASNRIIRILRAILF